MQMASHSPKTGARERKIRVKSVALCVRRHAKALFYISDHQKSTSLAPAPPLLAARAIPSPLSRNEERAARVQVQSLQ